MRWFPSVLIDYVLLACAMTAFGLFIQLDPNLPTGEGQTLVIQRATNIALGLPVGTNMLVTGLIASRIWYISRRSPEVVSSRPINAAAEIIIESGAAVIIVQLILAILVLTNRPSQNIALSTAAQIYVRRKFYFYCYY
jgi:hypothetical protein